MSEILIRLTTVLDMVGFASSTVREWVSKGEFPQPIRVHGKSNRWLKSEVEQWIADQVAKNREAA